MTPCLIFLLILLSGLTAPQLAEEARAAILPMGSAEENPALGRFSSLQKRVQINCDKIGKKRDFLFLCR